MYNKLVFKLQVKINFNFKQHVNKFQFGKKLHLSDMSVRDLRCIVPDLVYSADDRSILCWPCIHTVTNFIGSSFTGKLFIICTTFFSLCVLYPNILVKYHCKISIKMFIHNTIKKGLKVVGALRLKWNNKFCPISFYKYRKKSCFVNSFRDKLYKVQFYMDFTMLYLNDITLDLIYWLCIIQLELLTMFSWKNLTNKILTKRIECVYTNFGL